MARVFSVAALLGVALLLPGCSKSPEYEVIFEVQGTGSATRISYLAPRDTTPTAVTNADLPWRAGVVPDKPGRLLLEVTPTPGSQATCRIVVEGDEVAKKAGASGEKVTCETVLDELPANR